MKKILTLLVMLTVALMAYPSEKDRLALYEAFKNNPHKEVVPKSGHYLHDVRVDKSGLITYEYIIDPKLIVGRDSLTEEERAKLKPLLEKSFKKSVKKIVTQLPPFKAGFPFKVEIHIKGEVNEEKPFLSFYYDNLHGFTKERRSFPEEGGK